MLKEAMRQSTWVLAGLALAGCADCFPPGRAPTQAPIVRKQAAVAAPPADHALSVVDRARAEQGRYCGRRHEEREQGTLKETPEEKLDRDARCVELHKRDYVR